MASNPTPQGLASRAQTLHNGRYSMKHRSHPQRPLKLCLGQELENPRIRLRNPTSEVSFNGQRPMGHAQNRHINTFVDHSMHVYKLVGLVECLTYIASILIFRDVEGNHHVEKLSCEGSVVWGSGLSDNTLKQ